MKGFLIKLAIVVLSFMAGISVYLLTASRPADFLKKDEQARGFFNAQPSTSCLVYRRRNGNVVLNTAEDGAWYMLREGGPIDYCNSFEDRSHRFFSLKLLGYLYVWHYGDYPCVGGFMFDIDPTLLIGPRSIEFNSRAKARVR